MTNSKNVGIALVAVVIAIGAYFFPTSKTVVERVTEKLGAVSTLDGVDSGETSIGGVELNYASVPIIATSSTICSIPVPENATSTLLAWKVNIVTGITGAANLSLSTSTNGYATSSSFLILDRTVASGVGDSFSYIPAASSTNTRILPSSNNATGATNLFLLPGERLNLRIATTTAAGALGAYYTGTCEAVFMK